DGAFSGCISLTGIKLPDGVRKLGNGAFAGCINLVSMELSPVLAEIAEDSFAGCMRLDRSVLAKLQAINPDVQLTASEKCER
ncbi:MAG: leucine-rich repeat protein, partial [Selenomonadaceae bacterium]|nr:leucine-rich repeat protein [Selenomonadaceae bacterium]